MSHTLVGIRPRVGNQSVAADRNALLLRNLYSSRGRLLQKITISLQGFLDIGDVCSRDDEDVHRCLGVDIAKSNRVAVFVHDVGSDIPADNSAKETVGHTPV